MSTLIFASGSQSRWNHSLPAHAVPFKQLVQVAKEPLIVRTQKQFKDTVVVTHHKEISLHSTVSYKPEKYRYLIETIQSTERLWNGKVTILLGDVLYNHGTVEKIRICKELMFFGNSLEIFALVFTVEDYELIKQALSDLILKSVLGEIRGKLWHLYRHLNDIPLNEHRIKGLFTGVRDGTQDFDNWDQYLRYAKGKKV